MIRLAGERQIYDDLEVAEISDWIDRSTELFDLIVAADSLIYFGDLSQVIIGASKRLANEGVFAFTLENGYQYPFKLTDSGRYSHHADYVRQVCHETGLTIAHLEPEYLRMEYGNEVTGLFVVLHMDI
jgi:predicted TPR repeat methyltransferase